MYSSGVLTFFSELDASNLTARVEESSYSRFGVGWQSSDDEVTANCGGLLLLVLEVLVYPPVTVIEAGLNESIEGLCRLSSGLRFKRTAVFTCFACPLVEAGVKLIEGGGEDVASSVLF